MLKSYCNLQFFVVQLKSSKGKTTKKENGGKKMELKEVKKLIKKLTKQGYEVFYTKGDDADSIKVYEDKNQIIYINYNYSYIDIIEK